MSRSLLITLVVVLAVYSAGISYLATNPPPIPDPLPKQSHYVIFVEVCGAVEAVIVTGDPPVFATRNDPMSEEMTERTADVPPENVALLAHWDRWCPSPDDKS